MATTLMAINSRLSVSVDVDPRSLPPLLRHPEIIVRSSTSILGDQTACLSGSVLQCVFTDALYR
jgi:hypothetical protein